MAAIDEDWEEWDRSKDKFWVHATAGSIAGVVEHTLIFPADTVKTWMQVNRGANSLRLSMRRIRKVTHGRHGVLRMWRGMPVTMGACMPAHAAYFGVYEFMKSSMRVGDPGHHPVKAAAAGAAATTLHDAIMTPFDVAKQRLQLGFYRGIGDCITRMAREEGVAAFYRSFPTTLAMNVPYAATVVATNESLKEYLNPSGQHDMQSYLLAGAGSGALAAAVTTPLDVIKTRLQTQDMFRPPAPGQAAKAAGAAAHGSGSVGAQFASFGTASHREVVYRGFFDTVKKIYETEGLRGFVRGLRPRLVMHTPSVAISWGTYEFVKHHLTGGSDDY